MSISYERDHEVVQRLRPEPMTEREQAAQSIIDGIEFDIFKHKMHMVALEGKETTMKLGASTAMRWGDVAFGIFTPQGDLSVCATGIYHHAVLGQIPLKYIVKHWVDDPSVGVKEGDSFFYNDPFYAGVHNADMGLAVPVFNDGELICFIGAAVHTGEAGGSEPGGTVTAAKSKYDEGMLIPPIKIGEDFRLKEDLLNMLSAMTRDPRTMILDIKARLAAARIAERRAKEVAKDKGNDFFMGALRKVLAVTGDAARKKIAKLNDGIYRQPRFLDTLGEDNSLVKIDVTIIKKGDRLILDLTNSSPMLVDRPANSFFQGIVGLSMVYLCGWLFHDLPSNNGLLDCVDWKFDEDSLCNAKGDVSTSIAPMVQSAFTHGMFQCGAKINFSHDPQRAVASWCSNFCIPMFAGLNQYGEMVADITPEINATGCGARHDMDGVNAAGAFFATMADCSDVEATEADRPVMYTFRNYFNSSYGHGKFRGGAGVGFGISVHDTDMLMLGSHGSGSRFPSTVGLFGGYGVPTVFVKTVSGSNYQERMAATDTKLPTNLTEVYEASNPEQGQESYENVSYVVKPAAKGDTFYAFAGGGAGYGDVLERDPQSVLDDLSTGLVTAWAAKHLYHVVYNEGSYRLDKEATQALRQDVRKKRLASAKPFDEFNQEWQKLCPPDDVIAYYGNYPHPNGPTNKATT